MRTLLIAFLFLCFSGVECQTKLIDSLRLALKECKHDSSRARTLNALGVKLGRFDADSGFLLTRQALLISEKLIASGEGALKRCGSLIRAQSHHQLGLLLHQQEKHLLSLQHYEQAVRYWKELSASSDSSLALTGKGGEAKSLINIGLVHSSQSNPSRALECFFEGLKLAEASGQKQWQLNALGNIGVIYVGQAQYEKALFYTLKSLKLSEELNDFRGRCQHLITLGNIYYHKGDNAEAISCYMKSLEHAKHLNDPVSCINALNNIGAIYTENKDYKEALAHYQKAYDLAEQLNLQMMQSTINGNLGSIYTKLGRFREAELLLRKAEEVSTALELTELQMFHHQFLWRLYDTTGKISLAYRHFKKFVSARDSLNSSQTKQKIFRSELNFEYEKKNIAAKAEQNKKEALMNERLSQNRKQRNFFIAGCVVCLAFALFMINAYRDKRKTNKIILAQKDLVEQKQREIIDSIRYAKRIQAALFPNEKKLGEKIETLKKTET